jgi:hypothetical protein
MDGIPIHVLVIFTAVRSALTKGTLKMGFSKTDFTIEGNTLSDLKVDCVEAILEVDVFQESLTEIMGRLLAICSIFLDSWIRESLPE